MFLRSIAAASLAVIAFIAPAGAGGSFVTPAGAGSSREGFSALSSSLKSALADSGARGDALFIGNKDAIFYVETVGKADFGTPIRLGRKTDIAELMLLLSLVDSGFLGLDDPAKNYLSIDKSDPFAKSTIRGLMTARAAGGTTAERAGKTLDLLAESATARPWDSLFSEWIAKPLALSGTSYPQPRGLSMALGSKQPADALATNARDYAHLLSVLANRGTQNGVQILTPDSSVLAFHIQMIGAASCLRPDEAGACTLIEQDAVGLYAWVDRARGLYGVLAAPGAEVSVAKAGREIRAQAETILDRDKAAAGLTGALRN